MRKFTLTERFLYQFDRVMSKGTRALILWLFIASVAMIVLFSIFAQVFGLGAEGDTLNVREMSLPEVVWASMLHALDPGTIAGDVGSWPFRLAMFSITLGGIFLVSVLIGIITKGIEERIVNLRKGRSLVVEEEHTIILGWSTQVFAIIKELVEANKSHKKGGRIVILANKDKVEMDDQIAARIGDTVNTEVITRTGDPINLTDLKIPNPNRARSIIIPAPSISNPDSWVIKAVLALIHSPEFELGSCHVVAELRDGNKEDIAKLISGNDVLWVLADDVISQIVAQTSRQPGLSVVYTELLSFKGDEIYFKNEETLVGITFGEALMRYRTSTMIGLHRPSDGVLLNPPMDEILRKDDRVIVIAEDEDKIILEKGGDGLVDLEVLNGSPPVKEPLPERTLILGWNRRAPTLIQYLEQYVAPGSSILVLADNYEENENLDIQVKELNTQLTNQVITFREGNTTDRNTLESLGLENFQHLIILSYSQRFPIQDADGHTLVSLLHARDMEKKKGLMLPIVSEMLDDQNRALAKVEEEDDFIVSDKIISLLISQISENRDLMDVFDMLLDPIGCKIYLKPITDYIRPNVTTNFYTIIEATRRKGHIAIGYRLMEDATNVEKKFGVIVNPNKTAKIVLHADDMVIVLLEE